MKSELKGALPTVIAGILGLAAWTCHAANLTDGTTTTLTIALQANESLTVVANATSYTFTSNQNFTNGGVSNASDFSAFGGATLTLQASGITRYTTSIQINDVAGTNTNTSVTFGNSGANSYANNFSISLTNANAGSITFTGSTTFSGANALNAATRKNIDAAGATVSTNSGNLTLTANAPGTATGLFIGIRVNGGGIQSVTGSILLQGTGGNTGAQQTGVSILGGAFIKVTGASGTVTIQGSGGSSSSDGNFGIQVSGTATSVTTGGGSISVTGTGGGTGVSDANYGVNIQADSSGGTMIRAGGSGVVLIAGTGGASSGASNLGVYMFGTLVSTNDGNISMTGTGGPSTTTAIELLDGAVTAPGTRSVSLSASTAGRANIDVQVPVGSVSGTLTVTSVGVVSGGMFSTTGNLSVTSIGGAALNLPNTVGGFLASNSSSGQVRLINTATTLTLGTIFNPSDTTIKNTGAIVIGSSISSLSAGNVTLVATDSITESGPGAISTNGTLSTSSVNGTTLNGANAVGAFAATNTSSGAITLTNTTALILAGIKQSGQGAVSVLSTGTNTSITSNFNVTGGGGSVTLQATGSVNLSNGVTFDSGSGTLTLAADVLQNGNGDDGTGTLSIGGNARIFGAGITLRGADINIAGGATVGGATASGLAPGAPLTGVTNPQELAFDSSGNLFVTNSDGTTVSRFAPGATTPNATLTGLTAPYFLVFDAGGNLYVSNRDANTVSRFAPGATTPTATLTGLSGPVGLAIDGGGNLYVANVFGATVSKFAPGATTPTATLTGVSNPLYLAIDSGGNLFVSNSTGGNNTVSRFAPGATTPNATLTGLNNPIGLAFDGGGNLFVSNSGANTVSKFAPGATTPSLTLTGVNIPRRLTFDAAGNLFVVNIGGDSMSVFTPGSTTPFTTLTGLSNPVGVAVDGAGTVYVPNQAGTTVSTFSALHGVTTSVTVRSSIPTRPMFLGGSNNASVAGINLINDELASIAVKSGGSFTIGDAVNQTGDITFLGAAPGAPAAVNITVLQSSAGSGTIVLNNGGGTATALDSNGGTVTLAAGSGGIVEDSGNIAGANDISATVTQLSSSGLIGGAIKPLQFSATSLTADSSANNGNQFLRANGPVTIGVSGLNAGIATVEFAQGTFTLSGSNLINDTSKLRVNGTNTFFDVSSFNETVDTLTLTNQATINGTTGVLTSTNTILAQGGTCNAILAGTNGMTKTTGLDIFLNAVNTYTGATQVTAGRLFISTGGSTAAGSPVTVFSGATFGSSGTALGDVTYQSGSQGLFTVGMPFTIGGTLTLATTGTLPKIQAVLPFNQGPGSFPLVNYQNAGSSGAFDSVPMILFGFVTPGSTASINTANGVVSLVVSPPPQQPVVPPLMSDNNPGLINQTVTYNITATDADSSTLSYTFNFGDGSPDLTGTFNAGDTVPLSHVYTSYFDAGVPITLTVTDGVTTPVVVTATQFVPIPSSTGTGVTNVALNAPPVVEPLDGLSMAVQFSDGGVIQLAIDVSSLTRDLYTVTTDFGDVVGRTATVSGLRPVHKFISHGLFVAKSTARNSSTNNEAGRARLTLALSSKETGDFPANVQAAAPGGRSAPDNDPTITTKSLKGKVQFAGLKSDLVTYSGQIKLPAGLIMSQPHEFDIAIGNIVAQTRVDGKGKGVETTATKVLKSLTLKTKVKKGVATVGGEIATVTVTYSTKNLVAQGYDTEGINPSSVIAKGKSAPRKIQIAMLLDGAPFQTLASVDFKLTPKGDFGNFSGRK